MGPEAMALRQESFGETVGVTWSTSTTDREIVAFSTANGGAIVLGTLRQVERVAPVQSGAAVNSSIAIRALTSLSQSSVGFDVDSDVQILWYVPSVGSEEGIRVLGYAYNLVAAREVGNE
jgi:Holliday junction resolvasome RuvABC ATP-dependent DNA helicase subunit